MSPKALCPLPPARYPHHVEAQHFVLATASAIFAALDDPRRLAAHMTRRSWMTLGSRMELSLDAGEGREVGSVIQLSGRPLGVRVQLEEKVTRRTVPLLKVWETTGEPRSIPLGAYRMGFEIDTSYEIDRLDGGCMLRVFLDYELPTGRGGRWMGAVFAASYARWCVRRVFREVLPTV